MPFGGFDTGFDTGMCTSLHKSCPSGDTKSFSLYTVLTNSMELYEKKALIFCEGTLLAPEKYTAHG